jgi:hypothetical protein
MPRLLSDIQVRSDGRTRSVGKTHDLGMQQIDWLLRPLPDTLIIGTGWDGVTAVQGDVRGAGKCDIIILKTRAAIDEFNKLKREGRKVAIHLHSTC